jgi:hypothetical protein
MKDPSGWLITVVRETTQEAIPSLEDKNGNSQSKIIQEQSPTKIKLPLTVETQYQENLKHCAQWNHRQVNYTQILSR